MEKFIIEGGTRLSGSVQTSGAKNAILPIMAASLLNKRTSIIHQVPLLKDVFTMQQVLKALGAEVKMQGKSMIIDSREVQPNEITEALMRKLRASNLVMGSLLGRFGQIKVAYPGGCNIGSRPMDLHIKGLRALGIRIREKHGFICGEAANLQGKEIHLDFPSVGATENLMMAAVLAEGTTIIRNPAREPEIVDLQNFLNSMGARVKGAGLETIRIDGVRTLADVEHNVIPDRIEAGTHMTAAAISGGDVLVTNVIPEHVEPVTAKLLEMGVTVTEYPQGLRVQSPNQCRAVDFKTLPYPGFPTDMQPQMMALMAGAEGTSVITENIFENRFKHVDELRRMGADIRVEGRVAVVKGVPRLSGTCVEASDLRAGAALVLAGLVAEGCTVINNVGHLDRGYDQLDKKYAALGAKISRAED
ncbi:MAG: UDP-N-acetylglucosamine 1-carboxyvinyltransferase [Bacillota bacterium]